MISRNAVDIVQLDIAWTGGFSEDRRIAARLSERPGLGIELDPAAVERFRTA